MPIEGVDSSYCRPSPASLVAAGKHFYIGYVSPESGKNVTKTECAAFLAADIDVVLVWEHTAQRALEGASAGKEDGTRARQQANDLGYPSTSVIYTAVDFDATAAQIAGPVADYLKAFAAAAGGMMVTGVYGGIAVVRYVMSHDIMAFGWQTYAWSGGDWYAPAQLQQYHNGVTIGGCDTDLDRAMVDDFGQWEAEMADAPTPAQIWAFDGIPNTAADKPTNPFTAAAYALGDVRTRMINAQAVPAGVAQGLSNDVAIKAELDAMNVKIDAIIKAIAGLKPAVGGDLTVTGTLHVTG